MEFLFGKKKTPAQMLRENQRLLTRAMRDLDRERAQELVKLLSKKFITFSRKLLRKEHNYKKSPAGQGASFSNYSFEIFKNLTSRKA